MHRLTAAFASGIFTPNIENFQFIDSLKIMLRGMLSIFIVTGVLILLVALLNRINKKADR